MLSKKNLLKRLETYKVKSFWSKIFRSKPHYMHENDCEIFTEKAICTCGLVHTILSLKDKNLIIFVNEDAKSHKSSLITIKNLISSTEDHDKRKHARKLYKKYGPK